MLGNQVNNYFLFSTLDQLYTVRSLIRMENFNFHRRRALFKMVSFLTKNDLLMDKSFSYLQSLHIMWCRDSHYMNQRFKSSEEKEILMFCFQHFNSILRDNADILLLISYQVFQKQINKLHPRTTHQLQIYANIFKKVLFFCLLFR